MTEVVTDLGSGLASVREAAGRRDPAALSLLDRLCRAFPDSSAPFIERTSYLVNLGRFEEAETAATDAVSRFPHDLIAQIHWCDAAMRRGDWAVAVTRCASVRDMFPDHGFGYMVGARALRDAGDLPAAEALLAEAVERFPEEPGMLIDWADVAMRRRDWPESQRRCAALRERFPEHSFGYVVGARALRDAGDLVAAEALFAEAVGQFPQDVGALIDWTDMAMRRRDWPESQRRCAALRERFPDHSFGYVVGARALRDAGDLVAAEALLAEAAERFPQDAGVLIDWADAAVRRRDWGEAQRRSALLRERLPDHVVGYVIGARALRDEGRHAAAEAMLADAMERFPQDMSVAGDYALLALIRRDWLEALNRYETMREAAPGHLGARLGIAAALKELRRFAEAETALIEAAERFPDEAAPLVDLARLATTQRDWPQAQRRWLALVAKFPLQGEERSVIGGLVESYIENGAEIGAREWIARGTRAQIQDHLFTASFLKVASRTADLSWIIECWPHFLTTAYQLGLSLHSDAMKLFIAHSTHERAFNVVAWMLDDPLISFKEIPPAFHAYRFLRFEAGNQAAYDSFVRQARPVLSKLSDNATRTATMSMLGIGSDDNDYVAMLRVAFSAATDEDFPLELLGQLVQIMAADQRFVRGLISYIDEFIARDGGADPRDWPVALALLIYVNGNEPVAFAKLAMHLRRFAQPNADNVYANSSSIVANIVSHMPPKPGARTGAKPSQIKRKLRICFCLSGQLRGFRISARNLDKLGADRHVPSFVVHTWRNIGSNLPAVTLTTHRVFYGNMLAAYNAMLNRQNWHFIEGNYPGLIRLLTEAGTASKPELQELYGTKQVVVDDEAEPAFVGRPNQWKMLYKIKAAHAVARQAFRNADLFVRLRPDRDFDGSDAIDWEKMYFESQNLRKVFLDKPHHGLFIGDQIAIGVPSVMDAYVTAFDLPDILTNGPFPSMPKFHQGHHTLSYAVLFSGLSSEVIDGLGPEYLRNTEKVPASVLRDVICTDMKGRYRHEFDQRLDEALALDCADDAAGERSPQGGGTG
ncbi:MAG TPA: tetratricopeptide repeat protein [Stellaceae bacterium]|nr:tetratricopeptide repeat protein [Stellaceae bacterium]